MGQKVNPVLLRLGTVNTWDSRWFDERNYKATVIEDFKLRHMLTERLKSAGLARVEIERSINTVKIIIHVSRPGIVIGRGGTGVEELKKHIMAFFVTQRSGKNVPKFDIAVEPIKEPNLEAQLVARNISEQLLRRLPYKRILAQTAERVMQSGAKGVRIVLSGRIGGAEIGRREKVQKGTVPLSTIRENISFASEPSLTKKGYVGVKVWINKGEGK
jgi:small subunit ribosomal protein S3